MIASGHAQGSLQHVTHPAGPPALGTRYQLFQTFFRHPCRKLTGNRHVYAAPAKHSEVVFVDRRDLCGRGPDATEFRDQAKARGSMPPNRAKL